MKYILIHHSYIITFLPKVKHLDKVFLLSPGILAVIEIHGATVNWNYIALKLGKIHWRNPVMDFCWFYFWYLFMLAVTISGNYFWASGKWSNDSPLCNKRKYLLNSLYLIKVFCLNDHEYSHSLSFSSIFIATTAPVRQSFESTSLEKKHESLDKVKYQS